jgi:hypothetical protein
MNAMKAIGVAVGLAFSMPAAAVTWSTQNGTAGTGTGTICNGLSCQMSFTSGSDTIKVRAYSTQTIAPSPNAGSAVSSTGTWATGTITNQGSSGFGITNRFGDLSEGISPEHAVDNQQIRDIAVYELPASVNGWNISQLGVGWWANDNDVQVWIGGANLGADYNFQNVCFSGCANPANNLTGAGSLGFTDLGVFNIGGAAGAAGTTNIVSNAVGRYIVVAGASGDANMDAFKLSTISANVCTPGTPNCGTPPNNVPLPGTIALLGAGLLGLGLARRQTRA